MSFKWPIAYIKVTLSNIMMYIKRQKEGKEPVMQTIQKKKKKKTNILPASQDVRCKTLISHKEVNKWGIFY